MVLSELQAMEVVPQEAAQPPLEILMLGKKDFKGEKLHMLQIGLGNFGTFVQYLANPSEAPAYNAGIDFVTVCYKQ